jgi:hypothetical protein
LRINALASAGGKFLNKKAEKLAAKNSIPPNSNEENNNAVTWIKDSNKGSPHFD